MKQRSQRTEVTVEAEVGTEGDPPPLVAGLPCLIRSLERVGTGNQVGVLSFCPPIRIREHGNLRELTSGHVDQVGQAELRWDWPSGIELSWWD